MPKLHTYQVIWIVVLGLGALACFFQSSMPWLAGYPDALREPLVGGINHMMDWIVDNFRWLFRTVNWLLEWPLVGLQSALQWLPWSATLACFTVLAYFASGVGLAAFTAGALLYMVLTGYWVESMNTLALVLVSVPLAVGIGFGLGVWGYRSDRAKRIIQPCLDLMQTVPTFAYLIPILLLFGFGPVVGLIASTIYACPPMVRNVMLGLRRIPEEIIESAHMCGATRQQRFWLVEVPTALPQVMIGVNQTTMAALSMVIIAAIIGGFDDIGWEVLSNMRKAQFGQSVLSGAVIALIAMVMDRISWGFTRRENLLQTGTETLLERYRLPFAMTGALIAFTAAAQVVPLLSDYPDTLVYFPAEQMNTSLTGFVAAFAPVLDAIKNTANFFLLLPIKLGLRTAVVPFSWGFSFTPLLQSIYWAALLTLASWLIWRRSWQIAVAILVVGGFLFFGLTGVPWPVFFAVVFLTAWQAGGARVAGFVAASMLFILLSGMWQAAMLSIYLCGAAVLLCAVFGGLLGVWSARSDRVSRIMRPINDTLQTMPQFVYLIPVLMFFQIGDFSALIAVIAYAIVPMIRYTEHGLRNVRPDVIEAARSMGCTPRQILFRVQLPMALPQVMLGLNQTIMYGLGMLVIAALVGTNGLGQQVYIALGKADAGKGIVAGLGIALIAMSADRIIQAWVNRKNQGMGLAA